MLPAKNERQLRAPACLIGLGFVSFGLATVCGQTLPIHTLAGNGSIGATNGFGSNARFSHLGGIASDGADNIYVADTENSTIRKISSDGYVSTLTGAPGSFGSNDGSIANARFYGPQAVSTDKLVHVLIADSAN